MMKELITKSGLLLETPFAANFRLDINGIHHWMMRPILDTLVEVEKWSTRATLITIVQRNHLVEIRAYFPKGWQNPNIKFESTTWCTKCRKETNHGPDMCDIARVMES